MSKFKLTKIPLGELLIILQNMYEEGADFVDIIGTIDSDKIKDSIEIYYLDSYLTKMKPPAVTQYKVTKEDIKNRLN